MEELDLRHTLGKVTAPPGFEGMVLARVRDKKAGAAAVKLRPSVLKLSLGGGLAALLTCLILVNIFVLRKNGTLETASLGAESGQTQAQIVPVMDTVDYGREVRTISGDSGAVYILEQVSDNGTYTDIRY